MLLVRIAWRHRRLQKLRGGWVSEPPTCLTVRDACDWRGAPVPGRCPLSGMALAHLEVRRARAFTRKAREHLDHQHGVSRARQPSVVGIEKIDVSKRGAIGIIVGMCMVAMLAVGCGTLTGAAVGAGSGAAIGAAAGDAKKGALIGAGVGAAGGAIYDATR